MAADGEGERGRRWFHRPRSREREIHRGILHDGYCRRLRGEKGESPHVLVQLARVE
jgi:hypothetical protein